MGRGGHDVIPLLSLRVSFLSPFIQILLVDSLMGKPCLYLLNMTMSLSKHTPSLHVKISSHVSTSVRI